MIIFIHSDIGNHVSVQDMNQVKTFPDWDSFYDYADTYIVIPEIIEYAYRVQDKQVKSISDNYGRTITEV